MKESPGSSGLIPNRSGKGDGRDYPELHASDGLAKAHAFGLWRFDDRFGGLPSRRQAKTVGEGASQPIYSRAERQRSRKLYLERVRTCKVRSSLAPNLRGGAAFV